MTADDVDHRRIGALERDMQDIDADLVLEQLEGEVQRTAGAAGGVLQLAGETDVRFWPC